jgi:two-component system, cell cycle sensor histidine kinase and response regulator CckA
MKGETNGIPLRVLLVEDSEDDTLLCIRELRRGGYDVDFLRVEHREEFVEALERSKWDVILCDYTLPKFVGSEALAINREHKPEIPFIYVSGTIGEEKAIEALQNGADDYILKYDLKRLVPAVGRAIDVVAYRNERRALQEQLLQAQKMEALGQLTGGIAHDFNNVLATIIGNLEMLRGELQRTPGALRYAFEAQDAAKLGAELVRRLMVFSRRQPLEPKPQNLSACVEESENLLRRTFGDHIEIRLDLEPDLWDCLVDRGQLDTSLLNLAINARDAMGDGGYLTVSTRNVPRSDAELRPFDDQAFGDYVRLSVADTGTGMAEDVSGKVFDPFFTTKPPGEGTGLGLSMVHGFVTQSGGLVRIETAPDQGTTVHMYFPRSTEVPRAEEPASDAPAKGGTKRVRILVVEDNPSVRRTIVGMLEGLGHEAVAAVDGKQALSILENDPAFEILFADINLPNGILGTDLAREVRSRHRGIGIILTSGNPERISNEEKTGVAEAGKFLSKPWTLAQLRTAISEVLEPQKDGFRTRN